MRFTSSNKLRLAAGILGLALPITLPGFSWIMCKCTELQDSMSHYFYTSSNVWFIGVLWGLGLVLIFYPKRHTDAKGKWDGILTTFSGICAIIVTLCPTQRMDKPSACELFHYDVDPTWRIAVHYSSAGLMLAIFAFMSFFIFTRTYIQKKQGISKGQSIKKENPKKWLRNIIYRVDGVLIIVSIVFIGVCTFAEYKGYLPFGRKYTFYGEVAALVPFGVSWLIKGGLFLVDDDEKNALQKLPSFLISYFKV